MDAVIPFYTDDCDFLFSVDKTSAKTGKVKAEDA
jgi:hypothetical protein